MGKGAQQQVLSGQLKTQTPAKKVQYTLSHLTEEELQRWGELYGAKKGLDREGLLIELVRPALSWFLLDAHRMLCLFK